MGKCDDCQNHFERRAAFSARTQELYDLLIKPLRYKAKSYGYALALHGTVNYDIDLVAVPWREKPCDPQSLVDGLVEVVKAIHYLVDEKWKEPSKMPEGRLGYVIHLSHDFGNGPYIDLSVITPRISDAPAQSSEARPGVEGAHKGTTADKSVTLAESSLSSPPPLIVEIERETDGRWLADVPSVPGIMAYGSTRADAAMNALILLDAHHAGRTDV